jgi:hypothetical protein
MRRKENHAPGIDAGNRQAASFGRECFNGKPVSPFAGFALWAGPPAQKSAELLFWECPKWRKHRSN